MKKLKATVIFNYDDEYTEPTDGSLTEEVAELFEDLIYDIDSIDEEFVTVTELNE